MHQNEYDLKRSPPRDQPFRYPQRKCFFLKLQRNYYFIEPSRIEQMSQVWSHEISSFSHARDDDLGRAHGPQGPGILGQLCPPTWASEVLGPSALLPSLNRLGFPRPPPPAPRCFLSLRAKATPPSSAGALRQPTPWSDSPSLRWPLFNHGYHALCGRSD